MRTNFAAALAALTLTLMGMAAFADVPAVMQAPQTPTGCSNGSSWVPCRSMAAFTPTGQASLAVTTSSASVAFGSSGPTALVTNNGAATAYIALGASGVTAAPSGYPVNPGQSVTFDIGANTYLAAITSAGTASLAITTGTGLPVIAGGGSSGAGSQAPVTNAGTTAATAAAVQGATGMVPVSVTQAPSASAGLGITPVASTTTESSHVIKSSPGNLYSAYVVSTVAGYLMLLNAIAAPANGTVAPLECIPVQAGVAQGVSFSPGPPEVFSTGIVAVFSTTGCTTLTLSPTAWFKGSAQ